MNSINNKRIPLMIKTYKLKERRIYGARRNGARRKRWKW